ncbi:MAG: DUF1109 domain-containing protein [Halanaeroarchaeum sp.]
MDLELDGGTILYALGIGFALAALAYFARDVVFALSITVKAALLFVAFLAFLLGGIAMDRDVLDRVSLVLAAAAYVVFVVYVVTRYGLEATGVFFVLAASAALFLGLGYVLRQHRPTISTRTARGIAVALVAIAVLLVGADVVTGEVTYEADLEERVTVTAPDDGHEDREFVMTDVSVGRLVATNDGPFTRTLETPRTRACVVGTDAIRDNEVYLQHHSSRYDRPDRIGGGETLSFELRAGIPLSNQTDEVTLAVERGSDCETPRSEPTLVVDVDGSIDR